MSIELKSEHYRMTWETARRILSELPAETAAKVLNFRRCEYRMSCAKVCRGNRMVRRFCIVYQNTVIIRNAADWRKHNTRAGHKASKLRSINPDAFSVRLLDS